jgi:uncharacterized protein YbaR (Trm112 family)
MSFPVELLRCPISAQTMKAAPENVVRALQERQQSGALRTRGGEVAEPFENGLLTADEAWFFPIRGGIPVMLAGEAVAMREQGGEAPAREEM